ncbi:hypothetical protein FQN49_006238 [Arthroderma sp. PD_2]|nr:hypothetical protein FQN49_006238 [Arthroderma sp. PD_2]
MGPFIDLSALQTEGLNPRTTNIDKVSTLELCRLINDEDATVPGAIVPCLPHIADAIDVLAPRVSRGGRVIYVGAGTSGRLGVVDASEIPPTFSAPFGQFVALMAGGDAAMRRAQEGAEDDDSAGERDLEPLKLDSDLDALVGIAASGRTPYVLSCLEYAKKRGCITIGIACSEPSTMGVTGLVDYMITPVTGPEVVTGSTRMKAGTATKLALNMLSTGVMIKIGKTYGNMMVDVKTSNLKLQQRSRNIIRKLSGSSCPHTDKGIDGLLNQCDGSVKLALATLALNSTPEYASNKLEASGGKLSAIMTADPSPTKDTDNIRHLGFAHSPKTEHTLIPNSFVLYVDGGGTKCRAMVLDSRADKGEGEAGPCNVSDTALDTSIAAIKLAAERALENLSNLGYYYPHLNLENVKFKAIWIGLAGYDRPQMRSQLDPALSSIFQLTENGVLKLSNDIQVLASAIKLNSSPSTTDPSMNIVLVAGTGSVAVRYIRNRYTGELIQDGKSGGWGHLLGDDGSGFDLGRAAIRSTLSALDNLRCSHDRNSAQDAYRRLSPLCQRVLDHFGISEYTNNFDLLSTILTNPDSESSNCSPKNKIAGVAKLVLEMYNSQPIHGQPLDTTFARDNEVKEIITQGIRGLIRILMPLISPPVEPGTFGIVLSGGLLGNDDGAYCTELISELKKQGITFRTTTHLKTVRDPCRLGASLLAEEYLGRNFI